jgi:predicted phosphodiesterase
MNDDYFRKDGESDDEVIFRVCQDKDIIGTWEDVKNILNNILDVEYTESAYRKKYMTFDKMFHANQNKIFDDNYSKELNIKREELQKERYKLLDERMEYNRQIRDQSRKESYEDMIKRIICENVSPINFEENFHLKSDPTKEQDLLVHLTDIHTGIEIDNFNNKFDEDILKKRFEKYTNKIIELQEKESAHDCYIVISEIISGIIHNNLRLQNNMDMMQQFQYVSELISALLINIYDSFYNIYVYTVEGNHSRISPKKEDSLQGENMDILLPFYLKARLQNYDKIKIMDNVICKDIAIFNVRGKNVFASHGDKDSPENVVQNWTMMFGVKPDIIMLGHRHTNSLRTVYDTKVIESGCMSGTDEYALSNRKCNKPEQTISVIDSTGLVCLYDIQL